MQFFALGIFSNKDFSDKGYKNLKIDEWLYCKQRGKM